MNMDILGTVGTDGPLTRGRRRALAAGVTPGATPGLLEDDTAMAKHLFTDRTNNVDQVQLSNANESSPVHDWVKAASSTDASIAFDVADQNECPLTPSLGGAFVMNKKDAKNLAVSPGIAYTGPTPNNTPTSASVPQPAPRLLLRKAVNELQQVNEHHTLPQPFGAGICEDQETPTSPLDENNTRAGTAINEEDDDNNDLADLLDDLDIVAQASPLAADAPEDREQPTEAGPFPEAPYLVGTPAAPTGISRAPHNASDRMGTPGSVARTAGRAGQDTIDLGAAGCDDVIPTPGFFRPGSGSAQAPIESPTTPEDAPIKPFSFSKSAGSQFATPEIPIHSGMTPMTTAADARHAQKHIPAWNRCIKLVEKSFPLVAKQIKSLAAMPGPQPAWAHTPYMLLHSICSTKGWELSVRHESAPRIGVDSSVIATVNIPSLNDSGRTFTSTGRSHGQLESLLIAAAGTLQELLKHHLISGKDAVSAVSQAPSTLRHGSVPSVIGNMLHFGNAPVPSFNLSAACVPQQKRPPRPHSTRRSAMPPSSAVAVASMTAPSILEPKTTPEALSPHPGIGVRALAESSSTPELVLVNSPGLTPVTLGNKACTRGSSAAPHVYHPPMRTGTTSVSNKSKASIGATAKPIGIKALKEHQKEIERNMKRDTAAMASLQKATEKLSIGAPPAGVPLRGMPVPSGSHVVYHDDGCVEERSRRRPQLRCVPGPAGSYKRFSMGEKS